MIRSTRNISFLQQTSTLIQASMGALRDPTRQDLVAAVGELTAMYPSRMIIENMRDKMLLNPIGRKILKERPLINSSTISLDKLKEYPIGTLGRTYRDFLDTEQISPDTRTSVKYIKDDEELAYVMLRYRQTHDFVHALTGVPTTLAGELAIKWFEFAQTGLPMTLLAGIFGQIRLLPAVKFQDFSVSKYRGDSLEELEMFYTCYLPWALQAGKEAKFLMNVYYEECLDMDIDKLVQDLNIIRPTFLQKR